VIGGLRVAKVFSWTVEQKKLAPRRKGEEGDLGNKIEEVPKRILLPHPLSFGHMFQIKRHSE
jgi:hypothetical protein